MRLHHLEVTAFGPFAGTERVDFDALSDAGLFLFCGPTGAGKTSVLDAVCFALYGQVPGARGTGRSLRSDHAADSLAPEVVLEVTLRGRRLRITRSPQWERPKRRGSGTTPEHARVLVQERPIGRGEDSLVTLATRLDEAGSLLGDLLGLSLAQFSQVVLLPQGQFAEFLRAGAEQRRDLLESLFATGRFADVERWLVARRQDAARSLDAIDRRLGQVQAQIGQAAGCEIPDDLAPDTTAGWAAELLDKARGEQRAAEDSTRLAEQVQLGAADALASATLVCEAHQRRQALEHRLDELLAAAPEHEAMAAEVMAARRVAALTPLVEEAARLQVRLEAARAAAESSFAQLESFALTGTDAVNARAGLANTPEAAGTPARHAGDRPSHLRVAALPSPDDLGALARARRAESGGLAELVHDEEEADRLAERIAEAERSAVELDDRTARLAEALATAPARRAELEAAARASQAAAASLPGARAAVDQAEDRARAGAVRDQLAERRSRLADEVRDRTDQELKARQQWLDLRQTRLDGMAAELAQPLAAGEPCPVCGSTDHPQPAQPAFGAVSQAQESRAAEIADRLADELRLVARELADVEARLAAARSTAGGDIAVDELAAAAATAAAAHDELQSTAQRAPADLQALADFGEQHEELVRQRVALDEQAANLRRRIADDRDRLTRLQDRLAQARGDDPTVSDRARRLERLADALEALAGQAGDVATLEQQAAEALERAQRGAREQGIDSVEDVLPAARDTTTVERLELAVREYQAELRNVTEQLSEPVLTAVADVPVPDLAVLRERVRLAEAERDEAAAVLGRASHRVDAIGRLAKDVGTVLAERQPAARKHRTVDALSRLAEGKSTDNRLRMSLSSYVLAARLEQVAASASERLSRMSAGRYRLAHTAIPGDGRSRGGLQLRILDCWTGVERDPASLSGGESFLASLALALGLAEVVAAEAGGTLLETLFVDEGFGTLDDDTLDEVMGVLDGLRDGGRVVGIVSHVADLRARIPVQLHIAKGRAGSHVVQ